MNITHLYCYQIYDNLEIRNIWDIYTFKLLFLMIINLYKRSFSQYIFSQSTLCFREFPKPNPIFDACSFLYDYWRFILHRDILHNQQNELPPIIRQSCFSFSKLLLSF